MPFWSLKLQMTDAIVIIMIALIHLGKSQIAVEYLYGGPRLNNNSFIDNYFCCNAEGQFLQLTINGLPFVLFDETDAGDVKIGNYQNFRSFAALISVNSSHQEGFRYDAIVIVSVTSELDITVECNSDLGSNTTSNKREALSKRITNSSDSSGSLLMQQLFSGGIVPSLNGVLTYGFICGVQENVMFWTVESAMGNLQFNIDSNIGDTLTSLSSSSTFHRLAFLSANEPYQLVSVMFVTGDLNVTVSCTSDSYSAQLRTADLNGQDPTEVSVSLDSSLSPERTLFSASSTVTATELLSQSNMVSQAWRNELTTVTAGLVLAVGILLKRQLYC